MLCAGCGEPIATRSQRGRPARYHNATCRQRGRRARLATNHDTVLVLLANLETAASELRRALLAETDTATARAAVTNAMAELTQQLDNSEVPAPAAVTTPITNPPTTAEPDATTGTPIPARRANEHPTRPQHDDTNDKVIDKTIDMTEPIGPGWTLSQDIRDAEASI